MKRLMTLMAFVGAVVLATAQTLYVRVGGVTYMFLAEKAGEMTFSKDSLINILGNVFVTSEIGTMNVSSTQTTSSAVNVDYSSDVPSISILDTQSAATAAMYFSQSNSPLLGSSFGGLKLNFQMSGVTKVEMESVDGYAIAGSSDKSIVDFCASEGDSLVSGMDYYIATFPCDLSGGYRLSIYRNGEVAHYFGVHQKVEAGDFISPLDLVESDLEFDDPDAPLVEEERPGLNAATKTALVAYQKNPTEENKNALLQEMGTKYDKVVARKKAKLRELEREAKHQSLVDEMQAIVDEMVDNREVRLNLQFLRLIDPREDDDTTDEWEVLRGALSANNAYIGYAPLRNSEYAAYKSSYSYSSGHGSYPVVGITYAEAVAYCEWLSASDALHTYRLPTEEEWILAAGHMPKDVSMNSDHVEAGITSVEAYASTTGACGGIDFWGNCWEWTSTQNASGEYIVKGGSWDSSRDACRTEYSDDARNGSVGYANVGFRVVRVDR